MIHIFETVLRDLIEDRTPGWQGHLLGALLYPPSLLYRLGVSCRNYAYDSGLLKSSYAPNAVVVSIGNIVAGGTGKTPFTIWLAKRLVSKVTTAILTRGYRSTLESAQQSTTLSLGAGPKLSALVAGDEAYLMAKKVPSAYVFVGKNRFFSALQAVKAGAKLLLLEDGLQHRALKRDLEVILLDAKSPFGSDYFLPRGPLRDSKERLRKADLIVVNHVEHADHLAALLKPYTDANLVGVRPVVTGFYWQEGGMLPTLSQKRLAVFAGISKPKRLLELVKAQGADVVHSHFLGNHQEANLEFLRFFAEEAKKKGAEFLLCTEKDIVKIENKTDIALPIAYLEIDLQVVSGMHFLEQMISNLLQKVENL